MISEPHVAEVMTIHSGISEHIGYNLEYFMDIEETKETKLRLADCSAISTSTVGKVMIYTGDVGTTIENLYYVPAMNSNILSCSHIDKYGVATIIKKNICKLLNMKNNHKVLRANGRSESNGLYKV